MFLNSLIFNQITSITTKHEYDVSCDETAAGIGIGIKMEWEKSGSGSNLAPWSRVLQCGATKTITTLLHIFIQIKQSLFTDIFCARALERPQRQSITYDEGYRCNQKMQHTTTTNIKDTSWQLFAMLLLWNYKNNAAFAETAALHESVCIWQNCHFGQTQAEMSSHLQHKLGSSSTA